MGKMSRLGNELYQGRKSIDFVGRPWIWYAASLVLVGLAVAVLFLKPLNMGVEFTGGTTLSVPVGAGEATQDNADILNEEVADAGIENAENPSVTTEGDSSLTLQVENLSAAQRAEVAAVVYEVFPQIDEGDISIQDIGPSWGAEVAKKALLGIGIFLVVVVIFIWVYFREWRMSVAAILALFHDIALTVGVYALSGFQVTPSAVTGLLAILGFSLYDTVVVFDKVKENTTTLRKSTQSYADAEPDPGPLDQHRDRGVDPARRDPLRDFRAAGCQLDAGPRPRTVRRHGRRRVLVRGARAPDPRAHQVARDRGAAPGASGQGEAACAGRPLRDGPGHGPRGHSGNRCDRRDRPGRARRAGRGGRGRASCAGRRPDRQDVEGRGDRSRTRGAAEQPSGHGQRQRRTSTAGPQGALEARQEVAVTDAAVGERAVEALTRLVRDVPDFPEPGIVFKDITPLLADPDGFAAVVAALAAAGRGPDGEVVVDKVVGMEARGFIFAAPVALALGVGFVPVRKPGKLPHTTHEVAYELEYGDAVLQLHQDAVAPGERVLLVDDVLATGGTARATAELVRRCGAEVVGFAVLMELVFLDGRDQVDHMSVTSLLAV
jgi:adenine phosphoribosyltransferase